jgi:hypothetical protein
LMVHPDYKKYLLIDKAKEILNKVFGE